MAKYRSKVVEIEAWQWDGKATSSDRPEWMRGPEIRADHNEQILRIATLEGVMTAQAGDWIIRGTEGELYPCKPSVFERKYEPV